MSLLLDALRKSGEKQGSGLMLEDVPPPHAVSAPSETSASRSAGEALFAAKKKKGTTMRWNLGLVPTTLLICSVIGAAYGYYVWLEIQPPKNQRVAQRKAAPPAAPAPAFETRAMAPLVPLIPPAAPETVAPPPQSRQTLLTARNEDFDAPRLKPRASAPRSQSPAGVTFQRKVEADNVTPALIDAWQAYQRGDYVAAEQGYQQVLAQDAHNRDALLGLAAVAQQRGQDESAQTYYRRLLVIDPRDAAAQAALSAYAPEGEVNNESRLKQLLTAQPRSAALHFALGNLYAGQSNWAEAQQSYFNAWTLEPSNAQFAYNLAVSLDHLGQGKIAAQHYQQALQLDVSGNSGFDRAQAQRRLNELNSR